MKKLVIFATSSNPDAYINSIAYNFCHKNVKEVCLITIEEDIPNSHYPKPMDIVNNINNQLIKLSKKEYIESDGTVKKLEESNDISTYETVLGAFNKVTPQGFSIKYSEVEKKIQEYIISDCIFDVTGLKNNLLVEVSSIFISQGYKHLYCFDLRKGRSFDEFDLFHNLNDSEYKYTNLHDGEIITKNIKSIRKFNLNNKVGVLLTLIIFLCALVFYQLLPNHILTILLNSLAVTLGIVPVFKKLILKNMK